jgi:hypothetical protein
MTPDAFDPERLNKALEKLVRYARLAQDCFIMGEELEGRDFISLAQGALLGAQVELSLPRELSPHPPEAQTRVVQDASGGTSL